MSGSYVALRDAEQAQHAAEQQRRSQPVGDGDGYLPDFLK